MDEKKIIAKFSEAEFMELIKNDTQTEAEYKKELVELYSQRCYSEEQLIELVTGKTRSQVSRDNTLPELMRLRWALNFLTDNPCGNIYINRLAEEKRRKKSTN